MKRKKIINDPVYGFITVPFDLTQSIIEHPWFQRLSRIRQLGLTYLVYPGALHTRFHHALGAMHLMNSAIETLRSKGHDISNSEAEAVSVAILMHDMGHGPFSHALENLLVKVPHEYLSRRFMEELDLHFDGKFGEALRIFNNLHPRRFLYQLVSSQLDVDRLDYLNRDSFFTGVSEGVISSERIIKMLEISDGNLVVEEKGIYSVEKFITARRLMYWQVYLHKTVLAAEHLLINIIRRAQELARAGEKLFGTEPFISFLEKQYEQSDFETRPELLARFALIDDFDVFTSVKVWCNHPDKVLSLLCQGLINRKLYKIEIRREPISESEVEEIKSLTAGKLGLSLHETSYFVFSGVVRNNAYVSNENNINILFKNGTLTDIAQASDNLNISSLSTTVTKYFLCTTRQ